MLQETPILFKRSDTFAQFTRLNFRSEATLSFFLKKKASFRLWIPLGNETDFLIPERISNQDFTLHYPGQVASRPIPGIFSK